MKRRTPARNPSSAKAAPPPGSAKSTGSAAAASASPARPPKPPAEGAKQSATTAARDARRARLAAERAAAKKMARLQGAANAREGARRVDALQGHVDALVAPGAGADARCAACYGLAAATRFSMGARGRVLRGKSGDDADQGARVLAALRGPSSFCLQKHRELA